MKLSSILKMDTHHDNKGRFATGDGLPASMLPGDMEKTKAALHDVAKGITLYHGTAATYLPSILKEGLVPAKSKGGDDWGAQSGGFIDIYNRKPSVFACKDKTLASMFAEIGCQTHPGSEGVVLRLKVPKDKFADFHKDEATPNPKYGAVRVEHAIPASWIDGYAKVHPGDYMTAPNHHLNLKFTSVKKADEGTETTYVVLFFDGATQKFSRIMKFNEHHDAQGRFATADGEGDGGRHGAGGDLQTPPRRTSETPSPATSDGSREHPISCGDDIEKAAKLIAEGKHVILNQPDEIASLVEKIKTEAAEAKAKGQPIPTWNVADVSVPGTNLFAQDNLGIPRVKMPQLAGTVDAGSKASKLLPPGANLDKDEVDLTDKFLQGLRAEGIKETDETIPASHLRCTQSELDGRKIGGIVDAMEAGKLPPGIITVTRDNYILDGHHRWAADIVEGLKDGKDIPMKVHKLDLDIGTALTKANDFQDYWGISRATIGKKWQLIAKLARVLKYNHNHDEKGRFAKRTATQLNFPFYSEVPEGSNPEEAKLLTGKVDKVSYLGGGVTETKKVTFKDGSMGVFKPDSGEPPDKDNPRPRAILQGYQGARELGAWEVAKQVGLTDLVTPVVPRTIDGEKGVLSAWRDGDLASEHSVYERYDGTTDAGRAAMFDYVIGNTDRHTHNWLLNNGKLELIDHSLAFPDVPGGSVLTEGNNAFEVHAEYYGDPRSAAKDADRIGPVQDFAKPYLDKQVDILKSLGRTGLTPEAIAGVNARIDFLKNAKSWQDIENFRDGYQMLRKGTPMKNLVLPDKEIKPGAIQDAIEMHDMAKEFDLAEFKNAPRPSHEAPPISPWAGESDSAEVGTPTTVIQFNVWNDAIAKFKEDPKNKDKDMKAVDAALDKMKEVYVALEETKIHTPEYLKLVHEKLDALNVLREQGVNL